MSLPGPLRGWEATLGGLEAPEVWGPLLQRLDQLVGGLPLGGKQEGEEPAGLGGLARRGPPHRLTASAWALARAAPTEFLRRAAQDELLYLRLDREAPRAGRRMVLAFDTGPGQLGAARLGQLALWIVLARRASREGVELVPALLQLPQRPLRVGFSREGVAGWQSARSIADPAPGALDELVRRCGPLGRADTVWVVSPTVARPRSPQVVFSQDPRSPDELTVRAGGRSITLSLPPPDTCARLLRNPFAPRPSSPPRATAPGDLLPRVGWAGNGRRLLVEAAGDRVAAFAVPDSGRQAARVPHWGTVPRGSRLVGAGWGRQRVITVASQGDQWLWQGLVGQQVVRHAAPSDAEAFGWVVPFTRAGGARGAFVACGPRVYRVQDDVQLLGEGALGSCHGAPAVALWAEGVVTVSRHDSAAGSQELRRLAPGEGWEGAQVGWISDTRGEVVLARGGRVWTEKEGVHALAEGSELLGAWREPTSGTLWLVVRCGGDVLRVPHGRGDGEAFVVRGVDAAAMSPIHPLVGWVRGQQVHAWDLSVGEPRLQLEPP